MYVGDSVGYCDVACVVVLVLLLLDVSVVDVFIVVVTVAGVVIMAVVVLLGIGVGIRLGDLVVCMFVGDSDGTVDGLIVGIARKMCCVVRGT